MKKASKKATSIIMTTGIFVIVASQIISHYVELPDLTKGLFMGIGIGLLLLSLIFRNTRTVQ